MWCRSVDYGNASVQHSQRPLTVFDNYYYFFFFTAKHKESGQRSVTTCGADFGPSSDYLPLIKQQQKTQTLVHSCEWQDKMVPWNKHSLSRSTKPDRRDISDHVHLWRGIKPCEVSDKTMLHKFVQVGQKWDIELAEGGVIFYLQLDCTSTCSCAKIHKKKNIERERKRDKQRKYDVF